MSPTVPTSSAQMSKRLALELLSGGCWGWRKNDARNFWFRGPFQMNWMAISMEPTITALDVGGGSRSRTCKIVSLSQSSLSPVYFSDIVQLKRRDRVVGPQCSLNDRHMYITLLNGTGKKGRGPPAGLDESFRHDRLSLPTELRLARHWSTLWWFPFETWETTKMLAIKSVESVRRARAREPELQTGDGDVFLASIQNESRKPRVWDESILMTDRSPRRDR